MVSDLSRTILKFVNMFMLSIIVKLENFALFDYFDHFDHKRFQSSMSRHNLTISGTIVSLVTAFAAYVLWFLITTCYHRCFSTAQV